MFKRPSGRAAKRTALEQELSCVTMMWLERGVEVVLLEDLASVVHVKRETEG